MDSLGFIFFILLLLMIILPNYLFQRKLKLTDLSYFKYKAIYLVISISSLILVFVFFYYLKEYFLKYYFELNTNNKNEYEANKARTITVSIVLLLNSVLNIYFAKFYLKRISKTKNEIELIGKE
ncbi:hypothetical protein B0A68_13915 [Flavobacterium reichenbachii]|uniref:Uncharacterized protein n=1 Tax=Flavobacterium reichenbachii TaxID=362418 RepID=A0A085ZIJ7_9FLAO|nr:hypothetical protein IW19_01405 [Flavobacterium reichenbachii]OXB13842.1 hypothetical protein B0A68_13915 [Flavobacterium reichenbachii]